MTEERRAELAGQQVLVVGLGVSGLAAARALRSAGARVRVTESASNPTIERRAAALSSEGIDVTIGGHDLARLDAGLAVVSPGIAPEAAVVAGLRRAGVEVIGEVELAYRLASCELIAVTGTNGKTTVTSLVAAMLVESGINALAAGNIGLPLVDAVTTLAPGDVAVVEMSSFQLATIEHFRARVAVLLNIAEDHTDWHRSTDAYAAAKARIIENQTPSDVVVVNADDERCMKIAADAVARVVPFSVERAMPDGIGVEDAWIRWRGEIVMPATELPLAGTIGLANTLAAAATALEDGAGPRAVARAVRDFRTLPHRLQLVAQRNGVAYVDDSKATNPHATLAAVGGLSDVVLIAGGRSKGIDLRPLADTVPPVRQVIAIGESRDEIVAVFAGRAPVSRAGSMSEAVDLARSHARPGGSVLLSPGCASLDMYESYAARGDDFAREVKRMIGSGAEDGH